MTSCICHGLGICTLTNPSVGDVIYQESKFQACDRYRKSRYSPQAYAESNVTSCICHGLGICTLTNPSVGDVIYQESKFQACDRYRKSRYSRCHGYCLVVYINLLFT